jgi:uncharacterized membrane protein
MHLKKLAWISFVGLAISIGLYPFIYYLVDMQKAGLLQTKSVELLKDTVWHTLFYTHITFGAIGLLTGWSQFSQKFRNKYLKVHRLIGKVYVTAVFLSSLSGLYIAFYASAGMIAVVGFAMLAILWFYTNLMAYTAILKRDFTNHQYWMIRNYALTFAAVTLRLWLPLLIGMVFGEFDPAYRIVSWLCWVPNLIVAEMIIFRMRCKVKALDHCY